MILVDTSVWVDHLRRTDLLLVRLLEDLEVSMHPFIIGEIACGNLTNREEVLGLLDNLPSASVASHEEVMSFLDLNHLGGRGIGYVDLHLLASAVLSNHQLLTRDKRLGEVASELGITP